MLRIRRRLLSVCIFSLLLLAAGIALLSIYREVRQALLDQSLIRAVKRNDAPTVSALPAKGAKVNSREASDPPSSVWRLALDRLQGKRLPPPIGRTALLVALAAQFEPDNPSFRFPVRYTQMVKLLLDRGSDPNVKGERARTPLMLAAQAADVESLNALLAHGANRNVKTDAGYTPAPQDRCRLLIPLRSYSQKHRCAFLRY